MSVMGAGAAGHTGAAPDPAREPRVRELAREAVVLMAFSAGISVAVALLLLIADGVGR
jgi:hypothetical protein